MRKLLLLLYLSAATRTLAAEEFLKVSRFGTVSIYRQSTAPAHIVLFVSGDGGWNSGVVEMAKQLTSLDALVVGINIIQYLRNAASSAEKCTYAAADFEMLSQYVQRKLNLKAYQHPVLVGYSSGATLVYALLVQAPQGTFGGAMSLGFCPDLPLTKPFCRGNGLEWGPGPKGKGYAFLPTPSLKSPWVVLQGEIDQVCSAAAAEKYTGQVGRSKLVLLPKVGHGFAVPRNWLPQFKQAFRSLIENEDRVQTPPAPEVGDLPIVEIHEGQPGKSTFAVMISGDGGWAGIDRELGEALASRGIPVAGLSSLKYFWNRRTPEEAARDLERILRHYMDSWQKENAILAGYSMGADVLPFMASRLPADLRAKLRLIVLLGPSNGAEFEFHVTDWLGSMIRRPELPVLPEILKLRGSRILCLYGEDEDDTPCRSLDPGVAHLVAVKGGHHFNGKYEAIAELILKDAY